MFSSVEMCHFCREPENEEPFIKIININNKHCMEVYLKLSFQSLQRQDLMQSLQSNLLIF